jgi:hypothetical protein
VSTANQQFLPTFTWQNTPFEKRAFFNLKRHRIFSCQVRHFSYGKDEKE